MHKESGKDVSNDDQLEYGNISTRMFSLQSVIVVRGSEYSKFKSDTRQERWVTSVPPC